MADLEPSDAEIVPGQFSIPWPWESLFGRRAPVEVEIGCGGGRYLIQQAERNPGTNYLALERAGEFFRLLKARAAKRRLAHFRICRTDATDLVAACFPDEGVSVYHIYFPDPWPKKRHHKRRLISPAFCAQLCRTLTPTGTLYLATDHEGYLEELLPRLRAVFAVAEPPGPWEDAPGGRTNYEIKYMQAGQPIWRYSARKNCS